MSSSPARQPHHASSSPAARRLLTEVERAVGIAPGDRRQAAATALRIAALRRVILRSADIGSRRRTLLRLAGLVEPIARAQAARNPREVGNELDLYLDQMAEAAVDALHDAVAGADTDHLDGRARATVVSVTFRLLLDAVAEDGDEPSVAHANAILLGRHLERVGANAKELMGSLTPSFHG